MGCILPENVYKSIVHTTHHLDAGIEEVLEHLPRRTIAARASPVKTASIVVGLVGLALATYASGGLVHPVVWERPLATAACFVLALVVVASRPLAGARNGLRKAIFESRTWIFALAVGLAGTASSAWLSINLFQRIPRLDDSVAALFSARVFLSGHLTLPMPEYPEFFKVFGVLSAADGVERLAGMYPPGWSLLLAPGVALGVPWLVNPVLGGVLAVTVAALGTELYDRGTGRVAGILVVVSPLLAVISATHLSHTSTAVLCCLSMWATVRLTRTGLMRYAVVAGVSLGLALLTRPATGLAAGLVIALWPLSRPRRLLEQWRLNLIAVSLVGVFVALLLGYQYASTGDPLKSGHRLELGEHRGLGFVQRSGLSAHTPTMALEMTRDRLAILDDILLGWPVLAGLVVLLPFLLGVGRRRELWLLAPSFALLGLYAGFWYFPGYLPGRYLTAGLPGLLILAAGGWRWSSQSLADLPRWRWLPGTVLLSGVAFAIVCARPEYFSRDELHHGDVETLLPAMVELHELDNALVFMGTGVWRRGFGRRNDYYASGFRLNDLDLKGDVIFARSLRDRDQVLIQAYPDRAHYIYIFDPQKRRARLFKISSDGRGQLTYTRVERGSRRR